MHGNRTLNFELKVVLTFQVLNDFRLFTHVPRYFYHLLTKIFLLPLNHLCKQNVHEMFASLNQQDKADFAQLC